MDKTAGPLRLVAVSTDTKKTVGWVKDVGDLTYDEVKKWVEAVYAKHTEEA